LEFKLKINKTAETESKAKHFYKAQIFSLLYDKLVKSLRGMENSLKIHSRPPLSHQFYLAVGAAPQLFRYQSLNTPAEKEFCISLKNHTIQIWSHFLEKRTIPLIKIKHRSHRIRGVNNCVIKKVNTQKIE